MKTSKGLLLFVLGLLLVLTFGQPCLAGNISGSVLDTNDQPLQGVVVHLGSSSATRIVTTDTTGHFLFEDAAENTFYAIVPLLANYEFSPEVNFLQLISGDAPNQNFVGTLGELTLSPLDTPEFFVRQQYVDLLKREPDESGLNFWSVALKACGTDQPCKVQKRKDVMCAFIQSDEYQNRFTGIHITVC